MKPRPDTTRLGAHALVAWQGVSRRPLRNALTALSLLIGVLSIVLIQGAGAQLNDAIVRDAVLGNGRPATMLVRVLDHDQPDMHARTVAWQRALTRITADGGGVAATFVQDDRARVHTGDEEVADLSVLTVDPELRQIRPFPVLHGQWFETPTVGPQLVVNEAAWRQHGWQSGREVRLSREGSYDTYRARLIGVVDDGSGEPQAYVGLAGGGPWSETAYLGDSIALLLHSPTLDAETLHARISSYAQASGRTAEIGEVRRLDSVDGYTAQLDTSRRIFLGIGSLSLLVGTLGILNIGLATLRERAEELALRRSFGAARGHVAQIMIMESQCVALGAALPAIALAALAVPFALPHLVAERQLDSAGLPVGAMLLGLAAGCSAALLGALAPAIRAARLPIATLTR